MHVVMTLVPRPVLSLRSSGKEGIFSTLGACVAWTAGFLGDKFTSVPLPKAWMAFPVGKRAGRHCEVRTTPSAAALHPHPLASL